MEIYFRVLKEEKLSFDTYEDFNRALEFLKNNPTANSNGLFEYMSSISKNKVTVSIDPNTEEFLTDKNGECFITANDDNGNVVYESTPAQFSSGTIDFSVKGYYHDEYHRLLLLHAMNLYTSTNFPITMSPEEQSRTIEAHFNEPYTDSGFITVANNYADWPISDLWEAITNARDVIKSFVEKSLKKNWI